MTNDILTIGITAQSTDRSMPLLDLATATAERGFEALFVCEHTHMPSDHTSWPPGDEDRFISHLWDPFIALSFVAATTDLAIGTAVALPVATRPHRVGQGGGHPGQAERRTAHARLRLGLEPRGGGEPRLPTGGARSRSWPRNWR